ncbi:MAG: polysaccharide pyruvyl transferase CsaB [Clostridiales bacterium]|nr:polysaccharide pyruvyl transferase CsaB [Clostridiales bacterium]
MIFRRRGPKIVISGYYGFDNCGDEAVLLSIIHSLRQLQPDVRITVLSDKPEKTASLYDVKAVDRWSPVKVALAMLGCRLFISGGGSLIQDVTSARSANYYLMVIRLAVLLARKTLIYGQGVGPLTDEKVKARTVKTLSRCDGITVRDEQSAQFLKRLGVGKTISVACDPVMALSYEDVDRNEVKEYLHEIGILDDAGRKRKPLLLVVIRCWKDNRHIAPLAALLDVQARNGWDVLFAPAQFPTDMEAIDKISNRMSERLYCLGMNLSARQFLALTAYADKVFSMRLHGLIFAMAMGAPMMGLSYDPKVDAFMEQAGLNRYCLPFESFDWETAEYLMDEMEAQPIETLRNQEERRKEMHGVAWDLARQAIGMLA